MEALRLNQTLRTDHRGDGAAADTRASVNCQPEDVRHNPGASLENLMWNFKAQTVIMKCQTNSPWKAFAHILLRLFHPLRRHCKSSASTLTDADTNIVSLSERARPTDRIRMNLIWFDWRLRLEQTETLTMENAHSLCACVNSSLSSPEAWKVCWQLFSLIKTNCHPECKLIKVSKPTPLFHVDTCTHTYKRIIWTPSLLSIFALAAYSHHAKNAQTCYVAIASGKHLCKIGRTRQRSEGRDVCGNFGRSRHSKTR